MIFEFQRKVAHFIDLETDADCALHYEVDLERLVHLIHEHESRILEARL